MQISLLGINHNTAPVAIRERVALSPARLGTALTELHNYVPQGIVLSTCNRTEVYLASNDHETAWKGAHSFLCAQSKLSQEQLAPYIYNYQHREAVSHLFQVAAGLDSLILGEYEILGQVRQALEAAERSQLIGLPLLHLFRQAVQTGRRVREETDISRNALSVSSVAVELANRSLGSLDGCQVLVIGAGEAGQLAAKAFVQRGVSQIMVCSRSLDRVELLAEKLGGQAMPFHQLAEAIVAADVIVSCTGAPHFVLGPSLVRETMLQRPQRPLVIIDIAVPRDVEPETAQIDNVFLYDIDALTNIATANRQERQGEIEKATAIVADEFEKFGLWWQTLDARPTVSALVKKAEAIRRTQLEKTLKKLPELSEEERARIDALTKSIVKKLLHHPISHLKNNNSARGQYIQAVHEIFDLEERDKD